MSRIVGQAAVLMVADVPRAVDCWTTALGFRRP